MMFSTVRRAACSGRYGNTMKTVAATAMNAKSSRAHTIFKLMVEKRVSDGLSNRLLRKHFDNSCCLRVCVDVS